MTKDLCGHASWFGGRAPSSQMQNYRLLALNSCMHVRVNFVVLSPRSLAAPCALRQSHACDRRGGPGITQPASSRVLDSVPGRSVQGWLPGWQRCRIRMQYTTLFAVGTEQYKDWRSRPLRCNVQSRHDFRQKCSVNGCSARLTLYSGNCESADCKALVGRLGLALLQLVRAPDSTKLTGVCKLPVQ